MRRTFLVWFLVCCLGVSLTGIIVPLTPAARAAAGPADQLEAHRVLAQSEPSAGGFIAVQGRRLTLQRERVHLKGFFYTPKNYSPSDMWEYWDANLIAQDLQRLHTAMGINVIWVRVPYEISGVAPAGYATEELVLRMRELLQIADSLNMRVIFTLFDGYRDFPPPGKQSETDNLTYLRQLLPNFANDDRVIGWDMYYRPETQRVWRIDQPRAISWLVRMANNAKALAPNHLITVSLNNARAAWQPDFDKLRIIDFVDFIMLRVNDKQREEIEDLIGRLPEEPRKPIVLYDFEWGSGPPCRTLRYTEEQQAFMHYSMLTLLEENKVAGALISAIHDGDAGPTTAWNGPNYYLGMYRMDGSPKPVIEQVQLRTVAALPSATSSEFPLRTLATLPPRPQVP
ncbi:MAG: hypothetical protein HC876_11385, partial [Chloroflexaceae bacterium]|nr:hypothetical protein [Chloroflexaceae bacterium]